MKDEYWAEQFSSEVDGLLSENSRIPEATAPTEYLEALKLARNLAALDFSVESRQRETLRRRLLDESYRRQEGQMHTLRLRRALVFTILGTTFALALMLSLVYPGGIAAAAQRMFEVIQTIVLGDYSRAVQLAPGAASGQSDVPPDMWIVRTEIGNFGGNVPPGVEPVVRSLTSLKEAQAMANFQLVTPTYLPQGYTLREVKLAPIGGTHWVLSFYGGPAHDILVVQMPGGPQPTRSTHDPHTVAGVYVSSGVVTGGTLEETELDGRKAVWIEGHSLMWAVDNMTYEVGGLDLTLEEAKQIARALH